MLEDKESKYSIKSTNQGEPESLPGVEGFIHSLPTWVLVGCVVLAAACVVCVLGTMSAVGINILAKNNSFDIPSREEVVVTVVAAPTQVPTPTTEIVIPDDEWGNVIIGENEPIRIAVNTLISTDNSPYGLTQLHAAELAVIDFGGQIAGHDIEIVSNSSMGTGPGGEIAAVNTVSDETILAVLGHTSEVSCAAAIAHYARANLTMVSPSCAAGELTEENANRAFMRTVPNDIYQGRIAAEFAYNELGLRTAAAIEDGKPFSLSLVQAFSETFTDLGGTMATIRSIRATDVDIDEVLTAIAETEPDVLFLPAYRVEEGLLAVYVQEFEGLEDVVLINAAGLKDDSFISRAGDAAEGVYISAPAPLTNPDYETFLEAYEYAYDEEPPTPYAPESYDAMMLILKAIEEVALEDGRGNLVVGRKALRKAMYDTAFEGLSGSIICDEFGDCNPFGIVIYQVIDGEFVVVYE